MQSGDEQVAAFYARVMQRVCDAYRAESELPADEAAKVLQQKWKEKLVLYTGAQHSSAFAQNSVILTVEPANVRENIEVSSFSSSNSEEGVETEQIIGRPSAKLATATTSSLSIFAKMLGNKRKLQQLDGEDSDEENSVEWQDTTNQEYQSPQSTEVLSPETQSTQDTVQETEERSFILETLEPFHLSDEEEMTEETQDGMELPSSPINSTESTSLVVSAEDFAPVSGISGRELPLQLAAEYTKFGHRGTRRGYVGELRAIVLTWPSRLGSTETVLPNDLIWCYSDPVQDSSAEGEVVKVLSLGNNLQELRVKRTNGTTTTVHMDRVRRLKEYLIRKGSVRLLS